MYLWSRVPVSVQWRRYSSGAPWFSFGTVTTNGEAFGMPGKIEILTGGPSIYTKFDVNPAFSAVLRAP
jgi:hypothetical protein